MAHFLITANCCAGKSVEWAARTETLLSYGVRNLNCSLGKSDLGSSAAEELASLLSEKRKQGKALSAVSISYTDPRRRQNSLGRQKSGFSSRSKVSDPDRRKPPPV